MLIRSYRKTYPFDTFSLIVHIETPGNADEYDSIYDDSGLGAGATRTFFGKLYIFQSVQ